MRGFLYSEGETTRNYATSFAVTSARPAQPHRTTQSRRDAVGFALASPLFRVCQPRNSLRVWALPGYKQTFEACLPILCFMVLRFGNQHLPGRHQL